MREASRAYVDKLADIYEEEYQEDITEMKANGVRFYKWSSGDRAKLQVAMENLWEKWANKMADKNIPGREALRRYIELQEKYSR
jgi:TRAP-type C4-dicarboxylate transport system substrate-binding protein